MDAVREEEGEDEVQQDEKNTKQQEDDSEDNNERMMRILVPKMIQVPMKKQIASLLQCRKMFQRICRVDDGFSPLRRFEQLPFDW